MSFRRSSNAEKALDEQLFFEAFRTESSGHDDSISDWPIRGAMFMPYFFAGQSDDLPVRMLRYVTR